MNNFVLIRKYQPGDETHCQRIIHEATMSTMDTAFINGLTREITFQLMVLCSALMFIFLGFPFYACAFSIPCVLFVMYLCIWVAHKTRAINNSQELTCIPKMYMSDSKTCFWVAEAYEPHFMTRDPSLQKYPVLPANDLKATNVDISVLRKKIVGIVAIARGRTDEDVARLRRLAVLPKYRCKGIATALINQALQFSKEKQYDAVELLTTECHDHARKLYVKCGFHLKEMYQKPILGSLVTLLYYELQYDIKNHHTLVSP